MTEANRDEALKCDGLSKRYFDQKDYELAYKYAEKSVKLFNTEYSVKWLEKVRKEAATGQVENSAKYTKGQKEEVERFLKIDREDFYAILGVPKGAEDVDIKRAYRKLALQYHPDKNQAPGADEAFKMVSRAFSCLGDASKKAKYDQFGSEEPAGGFGNGVRYRRNANRPMHFEGDISPEDLFNMFFNGGFDGVQFNTRFGAGYGGPVFVQTFGQPFGRRTNRQAEKPVGWIAILLQVIPFIIIAILMLLINFLQPSPEPMNSWEAVSKHVSLSMTRSHPNPSVTTYKKIPYWTSNEFKGYFSRGNGKELRVYEDAVERQFLTVMQKKCQEEQIDLQRRKVEASNDLEEMERLQKEKCPSCEKLHMYSV